MLLGVRKILVSQILCSLVFGSTMLFLTSACVVIEKETSYKLISGQIKTSSNKYDFRKVNRSYKKTHKRPDKLMFYVDTGNSTFAYNARNRQISIVVWPENFEFEYVQNSGAVEQSNGEIYPIKLRAVSNSNPPIDTFSPKLRPAFGRSDLDTSFGSYFMLSSDGQGYTGYPEDSSPVSIYLPYKLDGVKHEVNLTTQKYVRRKLGLSDLTFTGNP